MAKKDVRVKDLYELYQTMGLPLDHVDPSSGFTIHYLQQTFKNLPYTSISFRPNYFSFLFIKDAFGKYTIDDKKFEVAPRTVYFTNPGNYRIFEWYRITDTCLITFDESFLKEYVHGKVYDHFSFLLTETVEPRTLSMEQFHQIEQLYRLIHKEQLGNSLYQNRIIGSLMVALLLKIKAYFFQDYNPIYEGNRSSEIVKTFKRDLELHFRDLVSGKTEHPLRVQDYAEKQSLHVNYLSSVISNKTGKPISAWISERTMTEAKVLLQNTGLSIKEISNRLSFLETSHFSNYFKRHASISPVSYRKQQIK
ncbi:AraC family transcriptional regulator [Muricauda oceani]|uniref:Helix-turn-helix transcriptional regulator n=1 Tax=Flagellimonas oceani TaxID=2698672 RepID=A0A6G7IYS9_9FLAO|nr:AraC family transcriptional regulator [Allomuricauda oceani]MBW8244887.1 AraC family transcriptional regulator [Allomuricauda oceani]QII43549.1 helix-turn-helix transcriptional regulator [Allomuricauda oceani]